MAFAAAGQSAEAAVERLAAAAHLRSAASFPAALDTLAAARPDAEASGRADLLLRIDGLRGNVLSRMGRTREGLATVRSSLDAALAQALAGPAAELYQRLADSLEHAGEYGRRHRHVHRRVRVLPGTRGTDRRAAVPRLRHGGAVRGRALGPGAGSVRRRGRRRGRRAARAGGRNRHRRADPRLPRLGRHRPPRAAGLDLDRHQDRAHRDGAALGVGPVRARRRGRRTGGGGGPGTADPGPLGGIRGKALHDRHRTVVIHAFGQGRRRRRGAPAWPG